MLGADTRATEDTVVRGGPGGTSFVSPVASCPRVLLSPFDSLGPFLPPSSSACQVADKNCDKIHYLAPNIYCCGAGTAADTENVTDLISSQLAFLRLQTGRQSRVVTAMTMLKRRLFQYQGHVSAALVLGGVDVTGPHLYSVYPHGSTDKLPFVTMGSGSLAAMAVMETGFKDDMTEEEAKELVRNSIRAGIFNDLGSGSNVDLTVIRTDGTTDRLRNYEKPNEGSELRDRVKRPAGRIIPPGATRVVREIFEKFIVVEEVARPAKAAGGAGSGGGAAGGGGGGAAVAVDDA